MYISSYHCNVEFDVPITEQIIYNLQYNIVLIVVLFSIFIVGNTYVHPYIIVYRNHLMQNEIVDLYNGVQWTAYTKEISKTHAGDYQFTLGHRLLC